MLQRDAERSRRVIWDLLDGFSKLFEGREGLAGGHHGSVKKLFVFLVRTARWLRREKWAPLARTSRAHGP